MAIEVREYIDTRGRSPFRTWFDKLDSAAAAKITVAIVRLSQGNTSSVKALGSGVAELKIDSGPGYRIYFGRDGEVLVILLGGGTKKRQNLDIADAKERWAQYKNRKKKG